MAANSRRAATVDALVSPSSTHIARMVAALLLAMASASGYLSGTRLSRNNRGCRINEAVTNDGAAERDAARQSPSHRAKRSGTASSSEGWHTAISKPWHLPAFVPIGMLA